MSVFHITAAVVGIGKVQHTIGAMDQEAAWARFMEAYAKRECILIDVVKRK